MANHQILARFGVQFPEFALDVDLALPGRGVTALFGASGSGKTTLLRCVAGLERAAGRLEINGDVWQDDAAGLFLPTHKRPLGYVFQDANLFPHLNVRRNLEFGWKRVAESHRRVAWDAVLELLGIGHLLDRLPARLSGGERQRVGIARALLTSPSLLLMDEPLAALDHARKQEILPYLERLHSELVIPVLYVSHQPEEVARLADHLVLLEQGRVVAVGPLTELLARPDLPLAQQDDAGAVIHATVGAHDQTWDLTRLDFAGGAIQLARRDLAVGRQVRLKIHARDVSLALDADSASTIMNRLAATVQSLSPAAHPAHVLVGLDVAGTPLLARITRKSADQLGLALGSPVWAQIKAVALLD